MNAVVAPANLRTNLRALPCYLLNLHSLCLSLYSTAARSRCLSISLLHNTALNLFRYSVTKN